MTNKVLLVIGGSSGIGSAIMKEAQKNDYQVIATSRQGGMDSIAMDVTDNASVQNGIRTALQRVDKIDAVLFAPAITDKALIHAADIEEWQAVYDVNILGALRVTKALLPHFMKKRYGAFVYLSSTAAIRGSVGAAAYASSKAALNSLAKGVSKEYGRFNIRAFTIMPGYVNGGMLKDMDEQRIQEISKSIALKRFAHVNEVAQFTVASLNIPYINGTSLSIDGGTDA
ncbi:beta-ketoacyl ACP reductase [Pseudomonas sp. NFACC02]|uniref:SDR family NAD(P)-dependent oxidoreductase n=1 Tax=Pseudomonas sp. NFACC02 TaxID=1566250 RepID=UPI0008CF4175|nr:SDR family oxidoreductase [Pseudomonas sp. NFACC02]SEQ54332.1 beta-ketoacyl ACP reductase [Pseudomonas sp. NFACC02]